MSKKQQRVFWPALIILSIVASAFVFANTRSRRATVNLAANAPRLVDTEGTTSPQAGAVKALTSAMPQGLQRHGPVEVCASRSTTQGFIRAKRELKRVSSRSRSKTYRAARQDSWSSVSTGTPVKAWALYRGFKTIGGVDKSFSLSRVITKCLWLIDLTIKHSSLCSPKPCKSSGVDRHENNSSFNAERG
ncbi:MAG TPA: hypothetical protein VN956_04665 [Pyrinomonadaceae bacterium]|nr:hypothetical protein [Pyrinomonadaceae bacterium]